MIAFETFNYLNKRNKMGIEIDMAKAYDKLEWRFIKKTLLYILNSQTDSMRPL